MNSKKTIFISAYRNVSIRYYLHTKILDKLRIDKNIKIVIFVKDNDAKYYQEMLESDSNNIVVLPIYYSSSMKILRSRIENIIYTIRMSFYGHNKVINDNSNGISFREVKGQLNVWKTQIQNLNLVSKKSITQFIIKYFIYVPISYFANRLMLIRKAIVSLDSILFPGEIYNKYFEDYKPNLLIVSSLGHMIDSYIMRAAKRHHCEVLTLFHNWDNATTKGYKGVDPDHLVVWSEHMKNGVIGFQDISKEKITAIGPAHWDLYFNGKLKRKTKKEFCEKYCLLKNHKIFLFGAGHSVLWPQTLEIIDEMMVHIVKGSFIKPVQLLVRLHPGWFGLSKNSNGVQVIDMYNVKINDIKRKYGNLIHFEHPKINILNDDIELPLDDLNTLAELISHSDILLTQYSTLLIEGPICDVPTINVGIGEFRDSGKPSIFYENSYHIKEVMKLGAFKTAYTYDELIYYVNKYLNDPSLDKANRKNLVDQIIPNNRGIAGEKIGNYIKSII